MLGLFKVLELTDVALSLGWEEELLLFCHELVNVFFGSPHWSKCLSFNFDDIGVNLVIFSLLDELGHWSSLHLAKVLK